MSDVKRYRPPFMFSTQRPGRMEECAIGEYVTYDDYAKLESRLAEVEAERERYANNSRKRKLALIEAEAEVTRLTALKDALAGDKINLVSELRQVKAELAKVEVALSEIQRWLPKHIAGEIARKTLLELRKD